MKTMMKRKFHYCRPQTKLQEGNVSTPVCHSVHMGGSVPACITKGSLSSGGLCLGGLCLGGLSRGVSVQGVSVQGVSVKQVSVHGGLCTWGLCPGGLCPGGSLSRGLCPGRSLSMGSLFRGSLSRGSLSSRSLPRESLFYGEYPGERPIPPSGNDWAVHILLECILVICSIRVGTKNDTLIRGKKKLPNTFHQIKGNFKKNSNVPMYRI